MGHCILIEPGSPNPDIVETAVQVIKQGGIVLSPTDTVYGLACDPRQSETVERILRIKGRNTQKGFLLLISTPDWVGPLTAVIPEEFRQFKQFWPGPVTLLFAAGPEAPRAVVGSEGRIGLRCPGDVFMQAWLESLEQPLLSTSANRSGEQIPAGECKLREMFEDSVDLLLLSREELQSKASTVVDLMASPPQMVRPGDQADRVGKVLAAMD